MILQPSDICGIVIAYHPAPKIQENIVALLRQVSHVVVVDNTIAPSPKGPLTELEKHSEVSLIFNHANVGIAQALNMGMARARQLGYRWVATFDQDSCITPGMVRTMSEAYHQSPLRDQVAIIGPVYQEQTSGQIIGKALPKSGTGALSIPILTTMTSGNLVDLDKAERVGAFTADLFIDLVDFEFCIRCIQHGFRIIQVPGAVLLHNLGTPVEHRCLGKSWWMHGHSAIREYYFFRNLIWLLRRYWRFFMRHPSLIGELKWAPANILGIMLFERGPGRIQKLRAIRLGIGHGWVGRMGPFNLLEESSGDFH